MDLTLCIILIWTHLFLPLGGRWGVDVASAVLAADDGGERGGYQIFLGLLVSFLRRVPVLGAEPQLGVGHLGWFLMWQCRAVSDR